MKCPDIDNKIFFELQLHHLHCETTDDKSDRENTLIINMLKLEIEY